MESEITPPDGGWGWMVVLGAALINMVNQALFSVFGLIFGETLKELAQGKATAITLVMAISVCVTNFSGLLVGPLTKKMNARTVTVLGVVCVGSGMIFSSFATQIWHIVVGYGVLTGLGLGLVASSTFLAINEYFTKRKSTAVGLSMAGTSAGQMLMPLFVGFLLKKYEFSGTTFILGLLSFTGIVGALFFKPMFCCKRSVNVVEKETVVEEDAYLDNVVILESQCELNFNSQILKASKRTTGETEKLINQENGIENDVKVVTQSKQSGISGRTHSCIGKMASLMGLHLLADFKFVHILIGLGLGYVSSVSFSTLFPMFLQDQVNFSMWQTTTCMTALSAADIAGRLTVSEICRKLNLNHRDSFLLGAVVLAVCRSTLVSLNDYRYVLAISIVVGYVRAVTVINQNLVISEYVEKDKLPGAVGLNMVAKGIFVMGVGQPLGMLKDAFDYGTCVHFLDVILMVITCSWLLEYALTGKWCRRKPKENNADC